MNIIRKASIVYACLESLANIFWTAFVRATEQYRSVNCIADLTKVSNDAVFSDVMPNSKENRSVLSKRKYKTDSNVIIKEAREH